MSNPTFTTKDVSDWKAYETVRLTGRWNMYDPRARQATGLSRERYSFVMDYYSELRSIAEHKAEIE